MTHTNTPSAYPVTPLADVCAAMRYVFEHFKLIVEPGAAVGVAAILAGAIDITDKTIATVATGGNIDPARFCELLNI